MKKLFLCYLGGKLAEGRIGEDHEVIMVVANDIKEAKLQAKKKWRGIPKDVHTDAILEVEAIDGYKIKLEKDASTDLDKVSHVQGYSNL